ncbi:hypothetical protein J2W18_000436 [Rhodococcus cercidiphylli]|nr:hypothetical protein [Rhodococcus cercidiphylli]
MKSSAQLTTEIKQGLTNAGIPQLLADLMVDTYIEAKRRYHLGDLRPNQVEGGRFAEAAFRVLEHQVFGLSTPIGTTLSKVPNLVQRLGSAPPAGLNDSLRIHIPRTLQAVYDIRNKRNIAHVATIDPNLQDSTLVIGILDWVMAEFVRLYHGSTADADAIVQQLVTKEIPAMQMFGSFPRILKAVSLPQHILILLYWRGSLGATRDELLVWVTGESRTATTTQRKNLNVAVSRLDQRFHLHDSGAELFITIAGEQEVDSKKLIQPV